MNTREEGNTEEEQKEMRESKEQTVHVCGGWEGRVVREWVST